MPKALVTGASGFIGSTLIEELASQGYEVHALLRKTSDVSGLEGLNYRRVEGDLSNAESLKKAVTGMDYVFHLAGVVTGPTREFYFEHNAGGTKRLAEAVASANPSLKRFIHVSSLAAAGPSRSLEEPRTEKQEEHPVSAYGESKLKAEHELLKFKGHFPVTIVRPPMVYGPRDKGVFVMIKTVSRKMMPLIPGSTTVDGSKYYSLVYVRDLCRGLIQAAAAPLEKVASGEIFYLTDGGIYTYRELMLSMARSLGVKPFEFKIPWIALQAGAAVATGIGLVSKKTFALNWDKLGEIAPDYWTCSSEKAKEALGYEPQYNLSNGMNDAIRWYQSKNWI